MNEIVIYTAIFNDYDTLKEPEFITDNCDYICFTDNKTLKSKRWHIVVIDDNTISASLQNRRLKILGPYYELKRYQYSLYTDGTILIKSDLSTFLENYRNICLVNFRHPRRSCIYSEFASCIAGGKGDPHKIILQCHDYSRENMPYGFGLSDNKIIFRNHQDQFVKKLMFEWWDEVVKYSGRDQTCLPFILFKNGVSYSFFREELLDNEYFDIWPHRNEYLRHLYHKVKWISRHYGIFVKQLNFLDRKYKTRRAKKNKGSIV